LTNQNLQLTAPILLDRGLSFGLPAAILPDPKPDMTPLDQALRAALADPTRAGEFYNVFLQTDLYIPTHDRPDAGDAGDSDGEETFNPVILEHEGTKVLLLFDRLDRLEGFATRELGYIVLPGHVVVESIPEGIHWILNHGTDHVKEFSPEEIGFLKRQIHRPPPQTTDADNDARVLVGVPARTPEGLVAALEASCARNPEIVAAHLGQVYGGGEGERPHLALLISTNGASRAARSAITAELVAVARQFLGAEELLELLIDQAGSLADGIRSEVPPFYSGSGMN